jgi:hypothetical protein
MDRLDARYRGSRDTITQELHQKSTEADGEQTQVFDLNGGPCRSRTCDQRIKSPLLYRLS